MVNPLMKRIEKLEQVHTIGPDQRVMVVRYCGTGGEEIIRLKCGDWQIDRHPGEPEDDFIERGKVAATLELPDPLPSIHVLMADNGFLDLDAIQRRNE